MILIYWESITEQKFSQNIFAEIQVMTIYPAHDISFSRYKYNNVTFMTVHDHEEKSVPNIS